MALGETIWLTTRFGNTLYRLQFIFADRLAVEVLIGKAFLNKHVIAILCTEQNIRFSNGDVPIAKKFFGGSDNGLTLFAVKQWTKAVTREVPNEDVPDAKQQKKDGRVEQNRARFLYVNR